MPFATAALSPFERVLTAAAGDSARRVLGRIDLVALDGAAGLGWDPTAGHGLASAQPELGVTA